jgi:hypothetical protein
LTIFDIYFEHPLHFRDKRAQRRKSFNYRVENVRRKIDYFPCSQKEEDGWLLFSLV